VISGTPWFDPARFHRALGAQGCGWGEPLVAVPTTTSTNDLALTAERAGATEGAVYVAREQTQGRGRRGNPWWAAAGDNLTFSVLLRPRLPAAKVHSLPLVVGLAVREVVAKLTEIAASGTTVVIVDQNARAALTVATRGYVMHRGTVSLEGTTESLLADPAVQAAYLGGAL